MFVGVAFVPGVRLQPREKLSGRKFSSFKALDVQDRELVTVN